MQGHSTSTIIVSCWTLQIHLHSIIIFILAILNWDTATPREPEMLWWRVSPPTYDHPPGKKTFDLWQTIPWSDGCCTYAWNLKWFVQHVRYTWRVPVPLRKVPVVGEVTCSTSRLPPLLPPQVVGIANSIALYDPLGRKQGTPPAVESYQRPTVQVDYR